MSLISSDAFSSSLNSRRRPLNVRPGSATANWSCIIWAEFVQTRVGCFETTEKFCFAEYDQLYSSKNRFQTRPNDATLPPISSRAPGSTKLPRAQTTQGGFFVMKMKGDQISKG